MEKEDKPKPKSMVRELGSELGRSIIEEGRSWLRWALGGAAVGAVAGGGLGFYYFGSEALLIGAGVGAVIGCLGALYLNYAASSF